jgi:hypothetical protein
MAFRVLVVGNPAAEYSHLRDSLEALLANRLPDVQLVTVGGPGLPALVASYAASRNLSVVAATVGYPKHRGNAEAQRDEELVEAADAAVVVREDSYRLPRLVSRLWEKGVRVVSIGPTRPAPHEPVEPRRVIPGMPPD